MAYTPRTIAQIQAQIIQALNNYSVLGPLLANISKASKFTNWIYMVAMMQNQLEQIWAVLQSEIETIISQAVPGTAPWIQAQLLAFEYGNTIVINPNFTIGYAVPNSALQIVSQAAVVINANGSVIAKVATGNPPGPLDGAPGITGPQCVALIAYLQTIMPLVPIALVNTNADILAIYGTVYYNGQSNAGIQTAVIAALTSYMADLPFNGNVKVSDVLEVIRAVPGVVDVTFTQMTATPYLGTPINIVAASTVLLREYGTYSGYIVNDPANTFADTLNFTVANN